MTLLMSKVSLLLLVEPPLLGLLLLLLSLGVLLCEGRRLLLVNLGLCLFKLMVFGVDSLVLLQILRPLEHLATRSARMRL
jgi:hypothetical protein